MHIKSLVQGTVLSQTQQCMSLPHDSVLPQGDAGECHTFYCHMWKLFPMRTGCDVAGPMYPRHKMSFAPQDGHSNIMELSVYRGLLAHLPCSSLEKPLLQNINKCSLRIPSSPLYIITLQYKHVNKWVCRDQCVSLQMPLSSWFFSIILQPRCQCSLLQSPNCKNLRIYIEH